MTKRDQLIDWLADAHAMEVGIITTLEKHASDARGQPKVRAAITQHLRETKKHATAVKQALESLGGSHPMVRESLSKVANLVAGLATSAARDTTVKNAIADYATEHFEIACYTALVQTATDLGEKEIAATCRGILREEKAMAKSLEDLFPQVLGTYLDSLDEVIETEAEPRLRPTRGKAMRK